MRLYHCGPALMALQGLISKLKGLWLDVRQWQFPSEFRIKPVTWNARELAVLQAMVQLDQTVAAVPSESPAAAVEHLKLLADVGTSLWRLRQKMVQPGT